MTPILWSLVFAAVSVAAAVSSALSARKANRLSTEITLRQTKTNIRARAIQDPEPYKNEPRSWWWTITNASHTAIVDVRMHARQNKEDLEKKPTTPTPGYAMGIPAQRGAPGHDGSGCDWEADALGPFITAHFRLSSDVVPDCKKETFLRVWWTEIHGEQDKRCSSPIFGLHCEHQPSGEKIYTQIARN